MLWHTFLIRNDLDITNRGFVLLSHNNNQQTKNTCILPQ